MDTHSPSRKSQGLAFPNTKAFAQYFLPENNALSMALGGPDDDLRTAALRETRRSLDRDYRLYSVFLGLSFVAVLVFGFWKRDDLGSLGAIIGGGGVLLTALLVRMGKALSEKSRFMLMAVLLEDAPQAEATRILRILANKL